MTDELIYESLAAKKNIGEDEEIKRSYFEALDEALKIKENKNIAITGGYGAGKSTILESYFEANNDKAKRMMRVSIATFQLEQEANPTLHENLLEQQILQQMFYQVNPNKIPNSRFVKISDLNFWYIFQILAFLLSTIAFTYLLISNDWMKSLNAVLIDSVGKGFWANLLLFLGYVILALLIYAPSIYLILMIFRKLGVSKFGIANANIEFNMQDGTTVFNTYMDEIIYLFRKSKYCYIIFEDLDRFQNVKIFESLRSLNTTLNNSAQLKELDIKFIYALKDDIFTNEDESEQINNRTKFFDFIIPTIKVMHSSNAESLLLRKLKGVIEEDNHNGIVSNQQKISKKLIEDLALFINDMRTLINICNEFQVFRTRLEGSSVVYNQLFAFIVYKNIYPKDYSHLLENKGLVHRIFNNKKEIIINLKNKISVLQNNPKNGIGSIITSKKDIAMLFARKRGLMNMVLKQGNDVILSMTNSNNDYAAVGEKVLDHIMNQGIVGQFGVYFANDLNNIREKYSNLDEFVTIGTTNFFNLYKEFDQKNISKEHEINLEIRNLEYKIKNIQSKSISRLLLEDKIDLHVDITNRGLLQLLIRNNWLNESYEDYLSVFHEGALKITENEYIKSVKIGSNDWDLYKPLDNMFKISQKIRVDDITSLAIININFVEYLLRKLWTGEFDGNHVYGERHVYDVNDEKEYGKLREIIKILFSDINNNIDLYIALLKGLQERQNEENHSEQEDNLDLEVYAVYSSRVPEEEDNQINLVREFFNRAIWNNNIDIWDDIVNLDISSEQKDQYANLILENADINTLEPLNSVSDFRYYISKEKDVTNLLHSRNAFNLIDSLGIKFHSLKGIQQQPVLINIIELHAYEITLENFRQIFKEEQISIELIKKYNSVFEYTNYNFDILIEKVLVMQSDYIENEEVLINYIDGVKEEDYPILETLVEKWNGVVSNLRTINSFGLLEMFYRNKKFSLTWSNIKYCMQEFNNNDVCFKISHILSNDENWLDLIENSSDFIQEENINNGFYNGLVNSMLQLGIRNYPMLKRFIEKLNHLVELDYSIDIDKDTLNLLIDNRLLLWDKSVYIGLESLGHKNMYILNNIKDAKADISVLISEDLMEWSIDIINSLIEDGDKDSVQTLLRNKILEIKKPEFDLLLETGTIQYDEDIIDSLLSSSNKGDFVIEYLLYHILNGNIDKVIELFKEEEIPWWNEKLFEEVNKVDKEAASGYLLKHKEQLDHVQIDEEIFNSLISKTSVDVLLSIMNKHYRSNNINSVASNRIYKEFENNQELIIKTLEKNAVIKVIQNLPIENAIGMLLGFLQYNNFNRKEVFEILSVLQTPFNLIKPYGNRLEIDSQYNNIDDLLNYLKNNLDVISGYDDEGKVYTVRNKRIKLKEHE